MVLLGYVTLAGWGGQTAGLLAWMIVLLPVPLLSRSLGRVISNDGASRQDLLTIWFATLLLPIAGFAVWISLATDHGSLPAAFGFYRGAVHHPVALWISRGCLVMMIVALTGLVRLGRSGCLRPAAARR